MTIWGEFKFYSLKNDHFGPFFGQIWPPNTPKSPKFRKSALTRLKHTCLWTLWRWWQVSGTSGIFRHLDFHEKSLNLVKLHRVPPVKFFLKFFWIFFFYFFENHSKNTQQSYAGQFKVPEWFFGSQKQVAHFYPTGCSVRSDSTSQPYVCDKV